MTQEEYQSDVIIQRNQNNDFPYPPPKGKIWKTGSDSKYYLVDDPNLFNDDGHKIKRRRKSNYTPPKKKRKGR